MVGSQIEMLKYMNCGYSASCAIIWAHDGHRIKYERVKMDCILLFGAHM